MIDLTPIDRHAEVYRKMHQDRFQHIEEKRRARDLQAENAALKKQSLADLSRIAELIHCNYDLQSDRALEERVLLGEVMSLVHETAQRYSRGSVTRIALDNLMLEITERYHAASLASVDDGE